MFPHPWGYFLAQHQGQAMWDSEVGPWEQVQKEVSTMGPILPTGVGTTQWKSPDACNISEGGWGRVQVVPSCTLGWRAMGGAAGQTLGHPCSQKQLAAPGAPNLATATRPWESGLSLSGSLNGPSAALPDIGGRRKFRVPERCTPGPQAL